MSTDESAERLPRCCETHHDWTTLAEHLTRDFPSVESRDVLLAIAEARLAAEAFKLDPAGTREVCELIVRNELMLLTGQLSDLAHLDPQSHPRRNLRPSVAVASPPAMPRQRHRAAPR